MREEKSPVPTVGLMNSGKVLHGREGVILGKNEDEKERSMERKNAGR
jgi:hypothetical protein